MCRRICPQDRARVARDGKLISRAEYESYLDEVTDRGT
jgi:hypothetical protein